MIKIVLGDFCRARLPRAAEVSPRSTIDDLEETIGALLLGQEAGADARDTVQSLRSQGVYTGRATAHLAADGTGAHAGTVCGEVKPFGADTAHSGGPDGPDGLPAPVRQKTRSSGHERFMAAVAEFATAQGSPDEAMLEEVRIDVCRVLKAPPPQPVCPLHPGESDPRALAKERATVEVLWYALTHGLSTDQASAVVTQVHGLLDEEV